MKLLNFKTKQEWLSWKDTVLGSTAAMAIMGVSPWMTKEECWAFYTGRKLPQKSMPWMKRGLDLEPLARREYMLQTNIEVAPAWAEHDKFDFIGASFDALNVKHKKLVEIKCPGEKDHAVALSGKIPEKYIWQLEHQLLVTGYEKMDYFSFDGQNGVIIPYKKNPLFQNALLKALQEMWRCIVEDRPPGIQKVAKTFQEKLALIRGGKK